MKVPYSNRWIIRTKIKPTFQQKKLIISICDPLVPSRYQPSPLILFIIIFSLSPAGDNVSVIWSYDSKLSF
jgi:hypothetical protein